MSKNPENVLTYYMNGLKGCHLDVGHPDSVLLCDGCDMGWHLDCIKPPIKTIPEGKFSISLSIILP